MEKRMENQMETRRLLGCTGIQIANVGTPILESQMEKNMDTGIIMGNIGEIQGLFLAKLGLIGATCDGSSKLNILNCVEHEAAQGEHARTCEPHWKVAPYQDRDQNAHMSALSETASPLNLKPNKGGTFPE